MCVTKEREGNPVIFPKILFEELMELEGDKGGKRIAKEHPEMIYKVYVTEQELSDMDYQEDKINLEKNIIWGGKSEIIGRKNKKRWKSTGENSIKSR